MELLICYDIGDPKRLAKVAKTVEEFAHRVQKSVFEGTFTALDRAELEQRLSAIVNREEDSVRFYRLCLACRSRVQVLGLGDLPKDPPRVVVA